MARIGVFYGSNSGNTRRVAKMIKKRFDDDTMSAPVNINKASSDDLTAYSLLILGTPTLGDGQLPGKSADLDEESWEEAIGRLDNIDLVGKTVALFGLGDQESYPNEFVNGLGELYDFVVDRGGKVVGFWPTAGYVFKHSSAIVDDLFVGLVIDLDNQREQTEARLDAWLKSISTEFELPL